jgi:O-acetyl-ADP-ribose deacetylase (regulator of RNase III)
VTNIRSNNIGEDWNLLLDFLRRESGLADRGIPEDEPGKWRMLRALMNTRPPRDIPPEILDSQDRVLQYLKGRKTLVNAARLAPFAETRFFAQASRLILWRGDITCLEADAIVNAANSALLGCFVPLHGCIDNAIHSAAGMQLRLECHSIMQKQGCLEPAGKAKITRGYNLPSRYVIHTVGPIVDGPVTVKEIEQLADCYRACLETAKNQHDIRTLALCCISTGEFHFPTDLAARIASLTVIAWLEDNPGVLDKVVFDVFSKEDYDLYFRLWETL